MDFPFPVFPEKGSSSSRFSNISNVVSHQQKHLQIDLPAPVFHCSPPPCCCQFCSSENPKNVCDEVPHNVSDECEVPENVCDELENLENVGG
ncbi:hypothetical protein OROGR_014356 [Orobanche gracilis]